MDIRGDNKIMSIEYEKEAAKHINKMDKPTKQRVKKAIEKLPSGDVIKLQGLTDLIDDNDMDTIFKVLVRFVPEETPLPDEIEAIERANKSIDEHGTIPHEAINWD